MRLDDPSDAPKIRVTSLYRYPVKSCAGHALTEASVEPWGLAGDRRWMLVDGTGAVMTARKFPRLLLAHPSPRGADPDCANSDGARRDGLTITGPAGTLAVTAPDGSELVDVSVWSSRLAASPVSPEADAWFSDLTGRPTRLVYLDDPRRRAVDPAYSHAGDVVSFADGFPVLLATRESLAALNDLILAGRHAAEAPLLMERFRPSVVVAGSPAWDEDAWRRVRIGDATFRSVKACDRCVLTTIDPETLAKGREPLATLAKHRQWDQSLWFAINLIPDEAGQKISVGDAVEVLERSEDPTPQR